MPHKQAFSECKAQEELKTDINMELQKLAGDREALAKVNKSPNVAVKT